MGIKNIYTPGSSNIAGWKMGAPDGVDVFPIKNGDIPASYVSLPEGIQPWNFEELILEDVFC